MVNNTFYHFVGSNLGDEIFLKKMEHQKKYAWKERTEAPMYILYWNFKKIPRKACLLFCNKRNSKGSIFCHSLIIEFTRLAWLWLRFEEKIHTNASINVLRRRSSISTVKFFPLQIHLRFPSVASFNLALHLCFS